MYKGYEYRNAVKATSKLLTIKVERKLLAICEVTGLAITIEAPGINQAMTYVNPLAMPANFLKLASLSSTELQKFEQPILAGLTLAIMKNWEMLGMEPPLEAAAQNLLLQGIAPIFLISYLRFFAAALSSHKAAYSYLPKLALKPVIEGEPRGVSLYATMKEHMTLCRDILYPRKDARELEDLYDEAEDLAKDRRMHEQRMLAKALLQAQKNKEHQQKALIKEGKSIVKEIKESNILSEKLIAFLEILFSADYLLTAETATKERAITALKKHQNPLATKIITIIGSKLFEETAYFAFSHPDDVEVEEDLETLEKEEEDKVKENPISRLQNILNAKKELLERNEQ